MPLSPRNRKRPRLRENRNGNAQFSFCLMADSQMPDGFIAVRHFSLALVVAVPLTSAPAAASGSRPPWLSRRTGFQPVTSFARQDARRPESGKMPDFHLQSKRGHRHSRSIRGHSSVGRAPALQAGCQGFESPCLHKPPRWRKPHFADPIDLPPKSSLSCRLFAN